MKPKLLDLFCKAGGATKGYQRAGFYVVGVDNEHQPHYCGDEFYQADALKFPFEGYDAYHASPPCQGYIFATKKYRNKGKVYPLLIDPIRQCLLATGRPYVIENCVGAPLIHPIRLCGVMFSLKVIRHRLFESNSPIPEPIHLKHNIALYDGSAEAVWTGGYNPGGWGDAELKKKLKRQYYTVVGHGGNSPDYRLKSWQDAMGIDWMIKPELVEAVPPAYTEYIGRYLIQSVMRLVK